MRLLVTGGCGFIGSNFIRYILEHYTPEMVTNVDALTYAGHPDNVAGLEAKFPDRYEFVHADIARAESMDELMARHKFYGIVNFAAESHVDRSIKSPQNFIHTNVVGTAILLDAARRHGVKRFIQVSTDEVYGSLGVTGTFTETSPITPSSPYSASKACADHLVLAYHKTFGSETIVTRCSNNYGRCQYPEKLLPVIITNAIRDRKIPMYGDGSDVRDWIFVDDHCSAIVAAVLNGRPGEVYNIGASCERTNLEMAHWILDYMGKPRDLIEFVAERPGHDRRYAIDSTKIRTELDWKPLHNIDKCLPATIEWYKTNRKWWEALVP